MPRPAGSKNLKTEEWLLFRDHCLTGGIQRFQEEMNKLHGRDYAEMFLKLLEFHKPKLARQELTGDAGGPLTITVSGFEYLKPMNESPNKANHQTG